MRTWWRPSPESTNNPCLSLCISHRDTVLHQQELGPSSVFRIGRSSQNPFCLDTPSLPMQHFTLVHFHTKGPLIQFTSTMRGVLLKNKQLITLDELKEAHQVHPTLHGYRLLLRPRTSITLQLDGFVIHIRWSRSRPHSGFLRLPLHWFPTSSHAHLLCKVEPTSLAKTFLQT